MFDSAPDIETERLLLREPSESDVPAMVAHLNNWESVRYTGSFPFPFLESDAKRRVRSIRESIEKGAITYSLIRQSDEQWLGFCGLSPIGGKRADLGYIMGKNFWGKGYMREALQAILRKNFDRQWFSTIIAETYIQNESSQKLLLTLGFQRSTGIILCPSRARGGEFPGYRFTMMVENWKL